MAKKKFGSVAERQSTTQSSQDEARLAAILAQPEWSREQAQHALCAQGDSGLTVAQFAKRHGLTAERLHNWKRKFRPGPGPAPQSQDPQEQPGKRASVQEVPLDLQVPGERFMYD